ncbi:hypothetical protein D3C84_453590 [compost metagenome]
MLEPWPRIALYPFTFVLDKQLSHFVCDHFPRHRRLDFIGTDTAIAILICHQLFVKGAEKVSPLLAISVSLVKESIRIRATIN